MFGFLKERRGKTQIANRIFEMHLYQYFLSEELIKTDIQTFPNAHENQFIKDGALNMDLVIKKFRGILYGFISGERRKFF